MRAPRPGSLLLAVGGLLLALGSFAPEIAALASRLLHPGTPGPALDRSHWIVFREDLDIFGNPDPAVPWWYYVFYAAEALGLLYFATAGILFAIASLSCRSRSLAFFNYLIHAALLWALAMAALTLTASPMSGEIGRASGIPTLLGAAGVLWILLLAEVCSPALAGRRLLRFRLSLVDAVNLFPVVFLLIINTILAALFLRHPNWPGGGYPVGSFGALLCAAGILLRSRNSKI